MQGTTQIVPVAYNKEDFSSCGPLHLTSIDWNDPEHRRSVAACLVHGVYILERDRQFGRQGPAALAPPWWEYFHFKLLRKLVDDADLSIFGAVFQYHAPHFHRSLDRCPPYVIAFRGTIRKGECAKRDIEMDLSIVRNRLHETSRFEIGIQTVRNIAASVGDSNLWLAGHSLGAAMALLAGKTMAKQGDSIQTFLFNSPFLAAPLESIKHKQVKHGIRIATSVITAGLALAAKRTLQSPDPFAALSDWVPHLFVNPSDHICAEYIGYFEHRKKMDDIGIGAIGRLATQNSVSSSLAKALTGKESEPLHLIPSALVVVNSSHAPDFRVAHGIHQWWKPDQQLVSKLYRYRNSVSHRLEA